jgi:hypothetical protein
MFNSIVNAITSAAAGVVDVLRSLFVWMAKTMLAGIVKILDLPPWMVTAFSYIASGLAAVWAISRHALEWALASVGWLLAKVTALPSNQFSMPTGWAQHLATANTFVPLDEAMAMLTTWCAIFLACVLIRLGKSLIPGIG